MCYKKEKRKSSKTVGSTSSRKDSQNSTVSSQTSSSQLNPRDFHGIQLRGADQRQDMQGNVGIVPGKQRTLVDANHQLIASVNGDTDTEVHFTPEGVLYITKDTLRQKADSQNGILRSSDILSYLHLESKEKDKRKAQQVKSKISKYTWEDHIVNYRILNQLCEVVKDLFHDFENGKVCIEKELIFLEKFILNCNDIILDHAGSDFLSEVIYLISNIRAFEKFSQEDKEKASVQFQNSFLEISRRHKEMQEELSFCEKQKNKQEKAMYMYGDDCRGFSWRYNQFFKKEGSDNAQGNYDSSTGYSYHYFIWLTNQVSDLKGGVTVETCAGKGGQMRVVFSIRTSVPDSVNQGKRKEDEVKKIDIQTVRAGKERVRNYEQQFNVNKLNLHFQSFKDYISKIPTNEEGKVQIPKEYSKNVNFVEMNRIYQLVSGQIVSEEEKEIFIKRYQEDQNFKNLIDLIKNYIEEKICLDQHKNILFSF